MVGDGDVCDNLVEVVFGSFVSISIRFVPIIDAFGENCALGSLEKYLEVELEMVDKDGVVGRKSHLGEFILVIGGICAVRSDSFTTLWVTLTLEESCACVLGHGID